MRNYEQRMKNRVELAVLAFVGLVLLFTYFGWSDYVDLLSDWLVLVVLSVVTTGIVQVMLQSATGDFLERIPLTFQIKGFTFSISLFVVMTILLKLIFFRGI